MAKNAHVLQSGSYNNTTGRFEFHDIEVFSSREKMDASVNNRMIDVNKGYNIVREESLCGEGYDMVTYKCMGDSNGVPKEMSVRYLLRKKPIQ